MEFGAVRVNMLPAGYVGLSLSGQYIVHVEDDERLKVIPRLVSQGRSLLSESNHAGSKIRFVLRRGGVRTSYLPDRFQQRGDLPDRGDKAYVRALFSTVCLLTQIPSGQINIYHIVSPMTSLTLTCRLEACLLIKCLNH